jgi:hypothetical protein
LSAGRQGIVGAFLALRLFTHGQGFPKETEGLGFGVRFAAAGNRQSLSLSSGDFPMVWFFYDTFDHSSVDQQWQDIADAVGEELAAMRAGYASFEQFLAVNAYQQWIDNERACCDI